MTKHQNAAAMTLEEWEHFSPDHDFRTHARCICGAHLSAPTRQAHEAHVAKATRATT